MLPGSATSTTSGERRGLTVDTIGARFCTASAPTRSRWRSTRRGTTPTRKRTAKTAAAATRMPRMRRTGTTLGAITTPGWERLIDILRSRSCAELRWYLGHGLLPAKDAVDHRHEEERGEGREREPADDDAAERGVLLAALAEAERHRQHAEDHRERRHDHRTEPRRARRERRVVSVELLFLALLVRELHDQDRVAGRHADAHHRAHQ